MLVGATLAAIVKKHTFSMEQGCNPSTADSGRPPMSELARPSTTTPCWQPNRRRATPSREAQFRGSRWSPRTSKSSTSSSSGKGSPSPGPCLGNRRCSVLFPANKPAHIAINTTFAESAPPPAHREPYRACTYVPVLVVVCLASHFPPIVNTCIVTHLGDVERVIQLIRGLQQSCTGSIVASPPSCHPL